MSAPRVLILSGEYPPVVEGGLARHVRKLSEQLVRDGVEVHVLTRGDRFRLPGEPLVPRVRLRRRYVAEEEDRHGVIVHRVREPDRDSASLARMAEQPLTDDALRDRLVAQASEHVLRFDWADVARQTAAVYEELRASTAPSTTS